MTSDETQKLSILQENDMTRELLAILREVTLDNGFLREQVSIRDEQVLRLSRQVQNLQVSYYNVQRKYLHVPNTEHVYGQF